MNPEAVDREIRKAARHAAEECGLTMGTHTSLAYEAGFEGGANWGMLREAEAHKATAAALAELSSESK